MVARVHRALKSRWLNSTLMNRAALEELRCDRAGGHPVGDPLEHLNEAIDWLVRAHDATPDGGVSRGYSVAWNDHLESRGWQPSYPETTGYIIPTLLELAACLGRPELRDRALAMADWEVEIQLPSGAVLGGVVGAEAAPSPAVFNTGQVILGWVHAHRETGRDVLLGAARRAGEFLLGTLDEAGRFCSGASRFARVDCTTYNTRVAWALALLGLHAGEPRFVEAARRNVEYALGQQLPNGWFRGNCLSDPERPLLHTIAYAARGVLETGLLLEREDFVAAAARTARSLAGCQRADGGLAGRFASDWSGQADWDCVTGDAQTSILWSKLARATGDAELAERARAAVRFVMRTQNRSSDEPGLRGGIKGSFPLDGEYGRFEILNWATKFFVDALLLTVPAERLLRAPTVES